MARILVVDDEEVIRGLLTIVLQRPECGGHTVATAEDGQAALARIEAASAAEMFDLVLTDVDMPGMTGTQLARCIQSQYPGLLIIIMSACGKPATWSGAFIGKPFDLMGLARLVQSMLSRSRTPPRTNTPPPSAPPPA